MFIVSEHKNDTDIQADSNSLYIGKKLIIPNDFLALKVFRMNYQLFKQLLL